MKQRAEEKRNETERRHSRTHIQLKIHMDMNDTYLVWRVCRVPSRILQDLRGRRLLDALETVKIMESETKEHQRESGKACTLKCITVNSTLQL